MPHYITMDINEVTPLGRMGAICSSEMSVDFQRTTRRYIAEGGTPLSEVVLELWTGADCFRAVTVDGLL
jgi:hypothetical protein